MDRVALNAFPIHSVVTLHDHLVLERARGSVTVVKARVEDRETFFVNAELVLLLPALSTPKAQAGYLRNVPTHEISGAPETDLCILD